MTTVHIFFVGFIRITVVYVVGPGRVKFWHRERSLSVVSLHIICEILRGGQKKG